MTNKTLYMNKYRVESARYKKWNYGSEGLYFITINTEDRMNFFGRIKEGKMILSNAGKVALKYWQEIPEHFDNVKLDAYIIMPNHIHGIIELKLDPVKTLHCNVSQETSPLATLHRNVHQDHTKSTAIVKTLHCNVSTDKIKIKKEKISNSDYKKETLQCNVCTGDRIFKNKIFSDISPKSKSLSVIIRSYKSICSKMIRKQKPYFNWHTRFHDRIIRTDKELYNVREYIVNNPINWETDRYQ